MIPSLLQLWLATVCVLAVAVAVQRWNRGGYAGRHRGEGRMSWSDEILTRAVAEMSRIRRLRFDDLTAVEYAHSNGAGRYAHLRTDELDAKAERDRTLYDLGLALRSPRADEMADVT